MHQRMKGRVQAWKGNAIMETTYYITEIRYQLNSGQRFIESVYSGKSKKKAHDTNAMIKVLIRSLHDHPEVRKAKGVVIENAKTADGALTQRVTTYDFEK